MKTKIVESSVLFISILKRLFLASCIGIIVGITTTVSSSYHRVVLVNMWGDRTI